MKTPMSMEIIESWSLPEAPKHVLTILRIAGGAEAAGARTIGLIIDLSNHETLCAWAEQCIAGMPAKQDIYPMLMAWVLHVVPWHCSGDA